MQDTEQQIQEHQYTFPYHHIPRMTEGGSFSQMRVLRWGYEYIAYLEEVLGFIEEKTFEKLLDVGCGDGKFLFEAKKRFPEKTLEGVDYSEQAVGFARAFAPNVSFHVGDITNSDILAGTYDIIALIEVLEHIPPKEIGRFLDALHKRMDENSILIITVPSDNMPVSSKHYQHFNVSLLKKTIDPYFMISEHRFLNRIGIGQKIIQSCLSNRFFAITQQRVLNFLFRYYKRNYLKASSRNGKRIFAVCRKK